MCLYVLLLVNLLILFVVTLLIVVLIVVAVVSRVGFTYSRPSDSYSFPPPCNSCPVDSCSKQ